MARRDQRPSRAEELEAKIRRKMAELAMYPPTGPTAWQWRETRKRIRKEIEYLWEAYDIARDVEGSDAWFFDDACEGA